MHCTVAIVGSGPAGLAAAITLAEQGIRGILVLEREAEPGGVPKRCAHSPFGMREFNRLLTGRAYSARLVARARAVGVKILTQRSVVAVHPNGLLSTCGLEGERRVQADRVLLAMGARESPRAARLVSGARPAGIMTTGALQAMAAIGRVPFQRPAVIGTELVAFSALLSCRELGIRPAAMLEASSRIGAWSFSSLLPLMLRVPLLRESRVKLIHGTQSVEGITVRSRGADRFVACDGVVFTGQFVPEYALLGGSHLTQDPATSGPVVDQFGRCSDPAYFAAGNLLRPVETAGWCWLEGRAIGGQIARSLNAGLPDPVAAIAVTYASRDISYVVPQRIVMPADPVGLEQLQLRFSCQTAGYLSVNGAGSKWRRYLAVRPHRRVLIPLRKLNLAGRGPLVIDFKSRGRRRQAV